MSDPRMTEHDAEQVRRWLAARDDSMSPPDTDHIMHETLSRLPTTPQARARFLGRWFDRGGGARRGTADRDHPPHSDRRSRLMYSALAVTTAIAVTALAVNVIDTDTTTVPSAGAASTHVVAADGSGDFSTITEAVAAAAEGDTVLVRPGSYVEAIVIDKDITLAGDGPREDIVIRAPEDGPTTNYDAVGIYQFDPAYILLIEDSQAEVRGLTFAGAQAGVVVEAGSPILTDLVFDENEFGLLIHSGSTARVTDSLFTIGGIEFTASEPLVEGNDLQGAGIMDVSSTGDGTVIRDNVLTDGRIEVGGNSLIESNTITGAGSVGISSVTLEGPAGAPVIRNNTIRDSRAGIQIGSLGSDVGPAVSAPDAAAALPEVSGNDISVEFNAISVNWTDAMISQNTIHDAWNGIVLFGSGSAEITDNEIDVEWIGVDIGKDTSPRVDGNTICGGEASIDTHESSSPSIGENTTCDAA